MSVKKTHELEVPIPTQICYETLSKIASEIEWKVLEENRSSYLIKWETKGSMFVKRIIVTASLRLLPSRNTRIVLTGEIPGMALFDGPGLIPKAWEMLLEPFKRVVTATYLPHQGPLCPTCGKQLPAGTRFCPDDGTPVE